MEEETLPTEEAVITPEEAKPDVIADKVVEESPVEAVDTIKEEVVATDPVIEETATPIIEVATEEVLSDPQVEIVSETEEKFLVEAVPNEELPNFTEETAPSFETIDSVFEGLKVAIMRGSTEEMNRQHNAIEIAKSSIKNLL